MFTYCPNCAVVFQVSAVQLSLAGGKVVCGECRHVYAANEYLYDDLAAVRVALDIGTDPEVATDAVAPVDYVRLPDMEQVVETAVPASAQPGLGGWEQSAFSKRDLASGLGIVGLLLLLGTQWLYFNRADLAADASWRPVVEQFCRVASCTLPLQADLEQLAIISRDVRQHPTVKQALLINAAFENRAGFDQPYPVFEISFTDKTGQPVAVRRFIPAEYLADNGVVAAGMPAKAPVQVVLEVMDPGEEAVSFQFGFL